jgi:glycosyltransferase involved in cell wall biosynthesis
MREATELVIVDDNSQDGSVETVKALQVRGPSLDESSERRSNWVSLPLFAVRMRTCMRRGEERAGKSELRNGDHDGGDEACESDDGRAAIIGRAQLASTQAQARRVSR